MDTGAKLRLKGQGEPGPKGGPRGDLTIVITVEPHPYFKREDRNLLVEVPITVSEAILGAKIEVPSLDGMKSLTDSARKLMRSEAPAQGTGRSRVRRKAGGRPVRSAQDRRAQVDRRRQPPVDSGVRRSQQAESASRSLVSVEMSDREDPASPEKDAVASEPRRSRLGQILAEQPEARPRLRLAVGSMLATVLVAITALGLLAIWHLRRRAQLIRDRLAPPRSISLSDPSTVIRANGATS